MEKNYIETLEYLLKEKKKKKDPTKAERKQFCNAWLMLVADEGYSIQAEAYLYNCSIYCGAQPYKLYLDRCDDRIKAFNDFFRGKMYGQNRDVTFRLLMHLFALFLNDKEYWPLIPRIIEIFPASCVNKEKKRLGTIEKNIIKYFFGELSTDVLLPVLSEFEMKPVFILQFSETMMSIIDGIDRSGLDAIKSSNIAKIQEWIRVYSSANKSAKAERNDSSGTNGGTQNSDKKSDENTVHIDSHNPPASEELPVDVDLGSDIILLLRKIEENAIALNQERFQQKKLTDSLSRALKCEQEKVSQAQAQISELQSSILSLKQLVVALEEERDQLVCTLSQKECVIVEKEAEIAERIKMADVLDRDRTKKADEAFQRIASQIKVEYLDFQDAVDVPMSCDLGENLRLQLSNIFAILRKGGMKF